VDCARLVPEMLQEVVDLMTEKELRLRAPLEELDLLLTASRPADSSSPAPNDSELNPGADPGGCSGSPDTRPFN